MGLDLPLQGLVSRMRPLSYGICDRNIVLNSYSTRSIEPLVISASQTI